MRVQEDVEATGSSPVSVIGRLVQLEECHATIFFLQKFSRPPMLYNK